MINLCIAGVAPKTCQKGTLFRGVTDFTATFAGTATTLIAFTFTICRRIAFASFAFSAIVFTKFASIRGTSLAFFAVLRRLNATNWNNLSRMLPIRLLEVVVVSKYGVLLEFDSVDVGAVCIHNVDELIIGLLWCPS